MRPDSLPAAQATDFIATGRQDTYKRRLLPCQTPLPAAAGRGEDSPSAAARPVRSSYEPIAATHPSPFLPPLFPACRHRPASALRYNIPHVSVRRIQAIEHPFGPPGPVTLHGSHPRNFRLSLRPLRGCRLRDSRSFRPKASDRFRRRVRDRISLGPSLHAATPSLLPGNPSAGPHTTTAPFLEGAVVAVRRRTTSRSGRSGICSAPCSATSASAVW